MAVLLLRLILPFLVLFPLSSASSGFDVFRSIHRFALHHTYSLARDLRIVFQGTLAVRDVVSAVKPNERAFATGQGILIICEHLYNRLSLPEFLRPWHCVLFCHTPLGRKHL